MSTHQHQFLPRSRVHRKRLTEVIIALSHTQGVRDPTLRRHGQRVARQAMTVAWALGCSDDTVALVTCGALLHDIGKIGIPDALLHKPGPLSTAEWQVMRQHPEIGADLLAALPGFALVAEIVRAHHEYYDGSGYPRGLRGTAIPLGARIVSVVDAYAAMIEDRVYAPATPHAAAIAELRRCAGTQFDPLVVEVFIWCREHAHHQPSR